MCSCGTEANDPWNIKMAERAESLWLKNLPMTLYARQCMRITKNSTGLIQVNLRQIFKNKTFYMDIRIEVFIEIYLGFPVSQNSGRVLVLGCIISGIDTGTMF